MKIRILSGTFIFHKYFFQEDRMPIHIISIHRFHGKDTRNVSTDQQILNNRLILGK
jgi:hypothetical protein